MRRPRRSRGAIVPSSSAISSSCQTRTDLTWTRWFDRLLAAQVPMVRGNPILRRLMRLTASAMLPALLLAALVGCRAGGLRDPYRRMISPVDAGYNTNNLLDLPTQADADALGNVADVYRVAESLRKKPTPEQLAQRRSVLCLSGGGSYGAYSAGVLCGWTASGDRPGTNGRPNFSVVTGISTGALIAPYVFLGLRYDEQIRRFYTTIDDRDIYRLRPIRGLFSIALADNAASREPCRPVADAGDHSRSGRGAHEREAALRWHDRTGRGTIRLLGRGRNRGPQSAGGSRTDQEDSSRLISNPWLLPAIADSRHGERPDARGGTWRRRRVDVDLLSPALCATRTANERCWPTWLVSISTCSSLASSMPTPSRSGAIDPHRRAEHLDDALLREPQRSSAALSHEPDWRDELSPRGHFTGVPRATSSTDFSRTAMTAMFNEGYGLARFGEGWRLTTGNGAGREHTSAFRNQPDRRATCAGPRFAIETSSP